MTNIGIVGAGVAGLHLGLYLRQQGIETTLYAEKNAEQQFASRIPALVARVGHTRERERQLGVNHWDGGHNEFNVMNFHIPGEHPMSFTGHSTEPLIAVDMRIYLGRLQEDFAARGGHVVVGPTKASDLEALSEKHDLLLVATGRGGITELFPVIEEDSPYNQPQRWISMGLFTGIRNLEMQAHVTFAPGQGEIFEFPIYSFAPNMTGLGIESIPGSAFDAWTHLRYEDDPQAFNNGLLELLREYAPNTYSRIDPEKFGLNRPLDLMQGGVTPAVRKGYATLPNGKQVIAIGDAHFANDPITGQGANTASRMAFLIGEEISTNQVFDEEFARRIEQRVRTYAGPVAKWSNAMLGQPEQHMIDLMVGAAQNQGLADEFARFFEKANEAWDSFGSPEGAAALMAKHGYQPAPAPAPEAEAEAVAA